MYTCLYFVVFSKFFILTYIFLLSSSYLVVINGFDVSMLVKVV